MPSSPTSISSERSTHSPTIDLGADAEALQMMGELVGAGIELRIGERCVLEHHRDRIGGAGRLGGEQLRQRGGRDRARGVVPLPQDGVALRRRENVEAADRAIGLRNRRLQQADQPGRQRLDARALEQVGGIFEHAVDPRRRCRPPRAARQS